MSRRGCRSRPGNSPEHYRMASQGRVSAGTAAPAVDTSAADIVEPAADIAAPAAGIAEMVGTVAQAADTLAGRFAWADRPGRAFDRTAVRSDGIAINEHRTSAELARNPPTSYADRVFRPLTGSRHEVVSARRAIRDALIAAVFTAVAASLSDACIPDIFANITAFAWVENPFAGNRRVKFNFGDIHTRLLLCERSG